MRTGPLLLGCLLLVGGLGGPAWAAKDAALPGKASAWVPGLVAALEDPHDEVASEALALMEDSGKGSLPPELLAALRGYFQKPRWVDLVRSRDGRIRSSVLKVLGLLDEVPAEQLPRLLELLSDSKLDENVRAAAIEALGSMKQASVPERARLVALLKDSQETFTVRSEAARVLGRMGEGARDQVQQLVALIDDPREHEVLRLNVALALGPMKDAARDQVPRLVTLFEDPRENKELRAAVARTLGTLGVATPAQARLLGDWLVDPQENKDVRFQAAWALGEMGEAVRGEVPRLMALMRQSKNEALRLAVAETLGDLGPVAEDQIGPLLDLLRSEETAYEAALALKKLKGFTPEQRARLSELLGTPDTPHVIQRGAADVLRALGGDAADQIPRLRQLLMEPTTPESTLCLALEVLSSMGAPARAQLPLLGTLLSHADSAVRFEAARALKRMSHFPEANSQASLLYERWRPAADFSEVQAAAASAWAARGEKSDELVALGLSLLRSEQPREGLPIQAPRQSERAINQQAVEVLAWMAPLSGPRWARVLEFASTDPGHRARWLMRAHLLGGGTPFTETLLRWTLRPENETRSEPLSLDEAVSTLAAFETFWPQTERTPRVRQDLARRIARVVELAEGNWTGEQRALLERHEHNLKTAGAPEARALRATLLGLERGLPAWSLLGVVALHLGVWMSLLFLYPRSPQVQALFFWDSRVRKVLGCWYVDGLLTWVPFLRRRLLAPFQHLLLADAGLERFSPGAYFTEAEVLDAVTGKREPLLQALPRLRGQVVLQGASGLGKSMFIRHLLRGSTRLAVFLPATRCDRGVLEAIQAKLEGHASGTGLLQRLVFSGALDIYIDGLNEATADTRAHIARFIEHNFHGNILVTTQRMEWTPPRTARLYELLPLTDAQVTAFLVSREPLLDAQAPLRSVAYREECERFVTRSLSPDEPEESRRAMREVLSNPMDLTVVAQLLSRRLPPDLFHLRRQQYELMARDYHDVNVAPFPLKEFSEEAYRMRLEDRAAVPEERFGKELLRMEDFKLVVRRQWEAPDKTEHREWHFRHDKIHEFFIAQTFLGKDNPRPVERMGDPRFRGVYFLLAVLLEPEEATRLRDQLVEHAARTRDHTVSDDFVLLLQGRREAVKAQGARRKVKGATGS